MSGVECLPADGILAGFKTQWWWSVQYRWCVWMMQSTEMTFKLMFVFLCLKKKIQEWSEMSYNRWYRNGFQNTMMMIGTARMMCSDDAESRDGVQAPVCFPMPANIQKQLNSAHKHHNTVFNLMPIFENFSMTLWIFMFARGENKLARLHDHQNPTERVRICRKMISILSCEQWVLMWIHRCSVLLGTTYTMILQKL